MAFLLLVRFLDLYEREPISIVIGMFFWGAIGAAILASLGNGLLQSWLPEDVKVVLGPMISAPVVEELAKGLALVAAFVVSRWAAKRFGLFEFDGVTDGIVYGAAIGIGFAFTEDLYYFFNELRHTGDLLDGLGVYLDRRDFFGPAMFRHAIWTATFGAGLGLATWSVRRSAQVGWPLLGVAFAMAMHATNNGLVNVVLASKYGFETTYDYRAVGVPEELAARMDDSARTAANALEVISWGYVVVFAVAVGGWLAYQRALIRRELEGECQAGLISAEEAELAPSFLARSGYYLRLLRESRAQEMRIAARMYGDLADLAFAKARAERRTGGSEVELRRRRARITRLRTELREASSP